MDIDSITWALVEREHKGFPPFLRYREFPKSFPKTKYPQRLNIFWKMNESDKEGLPTGEEFRRLHIFEDRLVEAMECDAHSILCVILTCNREREFVVQTADVSGFLERLTNMQSGIRSQFKGTTILIGVISSQSLIAKEKTKIKRDGSQLRDHRLFVGGGSTSG